MEPENERIERLSAILANHHASRTSQRHAAIVELSTSPSEAVIYALDVIRGGSGTDRAESLAGLQARVEGLVNLSTDDAIKEMAAHCVVLEALFLRYSVEAQREKLPDTRVKLQKLAYGAQSAHSRTLALIATLQAQKQGQARVVMHDDA